MWNISIPYSGKISRGPIFGVIANDRLTAKIKYKLDCTVHNGYKYASPRKMVEIDHPRKLNPTKKFHYTIFTCSGSTFSLKFQARGSIMVFNGFGGCMQLLLNRAPAGG